MQKITLYFIALFSLSLSINLFAAPTLQQQLDHCKSELGFTKSPPAGSCTGSNTENVLDTILPFSSVGGPKPEVRLGYVSLSAQVDEVFHCDKVDAANNRFSGTVEMIIHNRITGKTCFFAKQTSTVNQSTSFPTLDPSKDSAANSYWMDGVTSGDDCALCHTNGGPYFAINSAEAMAHFGLLNNGHDTTNTKYHIVNADATEEASANKIHAINNNEVCGGRCHQFSVGLGNNADLRDNMGQKLMDQGMMPPSGDSPYRWINRDTPNDGLGDVETLSGALNEYPNLACSNPTRVEAHVVGSDVVLATDDFPDVLETFNLYDGLLCIDADQNDKKCEDYSVQYQCGNGQWTFWYDNDDPGHRDKESRSDIGGLCTTVKFNGFIPVGTISFGEPIAIQARYRTKNGNYIVKKGPNDRLSKFSPSQGLSCSNSDQDNKKCSNYVVRFTCN